MEYGNTCFAMAVKSSSSEGPGRGDVIDVIVKGLAPGSDTEG